ncbi:DUF4091 domain-containing protein [Acidobacteria bacterium AH-259-O06]|nr:DUF4091 domain-containing protein [Acidobacteria bacterium AH-259-O06]
MSRKKCNHSEAAMKKVSLILSCVSTLAIVFAFSCPSGPDLDAWLAESLIKVFPDDKPPLSRENKPLLLVARNGHTSLQVLVRSDRDLSQFLAVVADPTHNTSRLQAELRHVGYVPVDSNPAGSPPDEILRPAPSEFPDPLYKKLPSQLKANRTEALWIEVYAAENVEPGDYTGEVTLFADGRLQKTLSFDVRVMEASVPAEQKLKVTNWFNMSQSHLAKYYSLDENPEVYWAVLGNIGRVMAEHKQNVILTPVSSLAEPSLKRSQIRFDFSKLDRWVKTFQDAGLIGTIEGGHLLTRSKGYYSPVVVPSWVVEDGEIVRKNLDPNDPRAEAYLNSFLPTLYDHLKKKGWLDIYLQHVLDEPHEHEIPIYERYAGITRTHLPGVPTIDAVHLEEDTGFLKKFCNVWVPVLGSFDKKLDYLNRHLEEGGDVWYYTCIQPQGRYLNRFIDYSLLKVRLLHWLNHRHNLRGFLHYGGNWWSDEPFTNVQPIINDGRTLLPAGDSAIVYPDPENNSVLSSVRLEVMREGIEDYELLAALAAKDPAKAEELVHKAIPHMNDYIRSPEEFREVHRALLEAASASQTGTASKSPGSQ